MKQFTLDLKKGTQRPVVHLDTFYGYDAMLDSGALFPVWVSEEETLIELGATLELPNVEFGGFGGKSAGKLYKLPMLQVGELIYPEFHIIACELKLPCHMLMSATMFRNLIYEIDDFNHRFNVTIPDTQSTVRNLVIWDEKGNLHVACCSGD